MGLLVTSLDSSRIHLAEQLFLSPMTLLYNTQQKIRMVWRREALRSTAVAPVPRFPLSVRRGR